MFNGSFGVGELLIVLAIVLLIFGPKRLPGLGKQLGKGMREFKDSVTGDKDEKTGLETGDGADVGEDGLPDADPEPVAAKPRDDTGSSTRA
jgi:sec-independent protein translocase protein TatA